MYHYAISPTTMTTKKREISTKSKREYNLPGVVNAIAKKVGVSRGTVLLVAQGAPLSTPNRVAIKELIDAYLLLIS